MRVFYKNYVLSFSGWIYEVNAMVIPIDHPSGLVA